jgi:hypothetical protein
MLQNILAMIYLDNLLLVDQFLLLLVPFKLWKFHSRVGISLQSCFPMVGIWWQIWIEINFYALSGKLTFKVRNVIIDQLFWFLSHFSASCKLAISNSEKYNTDLNSIILKYLQRYATSLNHRTMMNKRTQKNTDEDVPSRPNRHCDQTLRW